MVRFLTGIYQIRLVDPCQKAPYSTKFIARYGKILDKNLIIYFLSFLVKRLYTYLTKIVEGYGKILDRNLTKYLL